MWLFPPSDPAAVSPDRMDYHPDIDTYSSCKLILLNALCGRGERGFMEYDK